MRLRIGPAARAHALVATFFLLWSLVLLGGAWKSPRTLIPADVGDPVLNMGILHWNATTLPLTQRWWNFPSFAPLEGTGGFTENLLALSVIANPIVALTGDPVLAYNAVVLGSFVLSGIAMYALVFWLSQSVTAGLVAGIAFAFSPFRAVHLSHVQTLWTFGMPLALLGLHLFFAGGRGKALALFVVGWLLTIFGSMYFVVFFGVYLACWLAWFGSTRFNLWRAATACGVGLLASLPMVPLLLKYREIQADFGLSRTLDEIRGYSADMAGLFRSSPHATVASMLTPTDAVEGTLFPGLVVLLLFVGGIWLVLNHYRPVAGRRMLLSRVAFAMGVLFLAAAAYTVIWNPVRTTVLGITISLSSPPKPLSLAMVSMLVAAATTPAVRAAFAARNALLFYAASGVLMFLFCLGPEPTLNGSPILYGTPYRWLIEIQGLQGLRVPARFWMLGITALAVVAGLTVAMLGTLLRGSASRVLGPALAVFILLEGWMTVPIVAAPEWRGGGPSEPGAVVLELPAGAVDADVAAQFRAVTGGYRTANGYSGYYPPHYPALMYGLRFEDARVLAELRIRRPVYISLRREDTGNAEWMRTLGSEVPALTGAGGRALYRLDALPEPPPSGPPADRAPLTGIEATCNQDLLPVVTDNALDTRWHCGPQVNPQTLTFDMGRLGKLAGIVHTLGPFLYDFPRLLTVEVSRDLEVWQQVYSGETAALALHAGLADPRRMDLMVRFPATDARYVRLTQSGRDEEFYWSIAEIAALISPR